MIDTSVLEPRDRFVAVAAQLFAERGVAATSVGDIQSALGLTSGSGALYKHFRSKQALLEAVVDSHVSTMSEGRATFAERVPGSVDEALEFVVDAVWDRMRRDRHALRVLLRDLDDHPELLERVWSEVRTNVYDQFARWIADRNSAGELSVRDPAATSSVLIASLTYFPILDQLIGHTPGDIDADRYRTAWIRHAAVTLGAARSAGNDVEEVE